MICPTCQKEVTQQLHYEDGRKEPVQSNTWECPEVHVILHYHDDRITSYTLYFERDAKMYRLSGSEVNGLRLSCKIVAAPDPLGGFRRQRYVEQLNIPQYIAPTIKDDVIQIELLMKRIKNLVIFS